MLLCCEGRGSKGTDSCSGRMQTRLTLVAAPLQPSTKFVYRAKIVEVRVEIVSEIPNSRLPKFIFINS